MNKILCLLETAKFNVKNITFMLLHDLKGVKKKGVRTQLKCAWIHAYSY